MQMRKLVVATVFSSVFACAYTGTADAQKKTKRGAATAERATYSAGIAEAMGELKWGMSKDEVLKHFNKQIEENYRLQMAKSKDILVQERLRRQMNDDLKRMHDSFVRFDGEATGWDVSFLREEFTHRNGESMLVVRDDQGQNFYFFIQGRLWKWYRAFDHQVFAGASFEQVTEALSGRYGASKQREGQLKAGGETERWVEWEDAATRLRGIDKTRFYGFYCLVFEDKETLGRLDSLRPNKPRNDRDRNHPLVQAVTADAEASGGQDTNPDVADRISGKIRNRQDAPEKKPAK